MPIVENALLWTVFTVAIVAILALDLGVLHRRAHVVRPREAALWSGAWVMLALLFAVGVFLHKGTEPGLQFLTGYLIELSLSVDNVFLFAVIFAYFGVPAALQHRVLFWGILSAVVLRGLMIVAGAALIERFHFIIYLFGGLLILTGIKMFLHRNRETDLAESGLVRWMRRTLPVTEQYDGQRFLTRVNGRRMATPLFLVLALVECTDLMFAVDSIPAVFAITRDPFVVFTSNIFAILGLRSLYFLLAGVMDRFHYLKVGLAFVLVFVGLKMLQVVRLPILVSLLVVAGIVAISIIASLLRTRTASHHQDTKSTKREERPASA